LLVHKILGHWLLLPSNLGDRDYKIKVLDELAASPCLWKQRMSIVCSWKTDDREGSDDRNREPYQSLRRIKSKDTFEKWNPH